MTATILRKSHIRCKPQRARDGFESVGDILRRMKWGRENLSFSPDLDTVDPARQRLAKGGPA